MRYPAPILVATFLHVCMGSSPVFAQDATDVVLLENAKAKVTRADYDAELQKLAPEYRDGFGMNPNRVAALLTNLLVGKTLAAEGRDAGVERDPAVQKRIAMETERVLVEAQVGRIETAAGREFDARKADYMLKVREIYLVDKAKYRRPDEIVASFVLFQSKPQSPEGALRLAQDTRAKLLAGADYSVLVKELTADPRANAKAGQLESQNARGEDHALIAAGAALGKAGDWSEPVATGAGYGLVRLDERRPGRELSFDEVKDGILADMRKRYVNEQRDARIAAIRGDPNVKTNQQAIEALVTRVDSSAFKPNAAPTPK